MDRMFAVTDNCICNISSNLPAERYTPLPRMPEDVTIFWIVTDESSSDDDVDEWKNYIITDLLSTLCIYLSNIMHYE